MIDHLLVLEAHARSGLRQQRRTATGNKGDHQVVVRQAGNRLHDAPRRQVAGNVRDRVRRLDDLDTLAGHGVAVAGDDKAGNRAVPRLLEGLRHLGRGLAGADHHRAPLGRRRQIGLHGRAGLGRSDCDAEQVFEEVAIHTSRRQGERAS